MVQTKLLIKKESTLLEGLNDEQITAVTHGEGPLLIVAGAGTGKTTVITRRIAYLIEQGVKPENILALAFADKAAEEMEERVDRLLPMGYVNVNVSTFHSFGEQVLRQYGLLLGLPDFQVLDEVGQWLLTRNNFDKFDLNYYRPMGNPTALIKALVQHFSKAKDEMITPEEYLEYAEGIKLNKDQAESGVDEKARLQEVASAYHTYQKLLLEHGYLDFGDLINYPLELFKKRPQVLKKLREQYQYILVDEFQDTNLAQYELLKLLSGPKNSITVVGDDDQSIFKFRGASISNIMHFRSDYPEARFITLIQNYRNTPKILSASYQFITQNNPDRLEVKLGISKKLQANQKQESEIIQMVAATQADEAEMAVAKIKELLSQYPELTWSDFAILARSHNLLTPVTQELERQQVPYLYAASSGLYRKSLILDLLSYFKLLDNYHESSALFRILKLPVFHIAERAVIELTNFAKIRTLSLYQALEQAAVVKNIDEHSLVGIQKLLELLTRHSRLAREKTALEVFLTVFEELGLAGRLKASEEASVREENEAVQNRRYLEAFRKKIQDFETQNEDRQLLAFLNLIEFEKQAGSLGELEIDLAEAGPEAVRVMSVHAAKGLEFANVFLIGLVDKRFPAIERREPIELPEALVKEILPEGDAHLQEERRLFYVAMTRAKFNLYLTRARDYGGKRTKRPSRFLLEMGLTQDEQVWPTGEVELKKAALRKSEYPSPKVFSWSQISDFLDCPLKYKYRHILKIPEKGSAVLSFGRSIHKTFQKFLNLYRQQQASQDLFGATKAGQLPEFETLRKLYEESWIDEWYESQNQKQEFQREGQRILKDFYENIKTAQPQVKHLEYGFKVRLGKYQYKGFIDRIDETAGGLVLIDYKTGAPRPLTAVEKEQLLSYQLVAGQVFDKPIGELQYWYLRERFEVTSFLGKTGELKKLEAKLIQTVEMIIEAAKNDSFRGLHERTPHHAECQYLELEL